MRCVSHWVRCSVLGLALASTGFLGMSLVTNARADGTPPAKKDHKAPATQPIKLGEDFDKLGLNNDQKTEIASLRKDLKADVLKLQTDEKTKELAVLTPDQQSALKALEAEHAKAKDAAKAAKNATQPATTQK